MERRSTILLVEANADDVFFFELALRECGKDYDMHVVRSGNEAIDYLQRACRGGDVPGYPVPKFIIMDSYTRRISGRREARLPPGRAWLFRQARR